MLQDGSTQESWKNEARGTSCGIPVSLLLQYRSSSVKVHAWMFARGNAKKGRRTCKWWKFEKENHLGYHTYLPVNVWNFWKYCLCCCFKSMQQALFYVNFYLNIVFRGFQESGPAIYSPSQEDRFSTKPEKYHHIISSTTLIILMHWPRHLHCEVLEFTFWGHRWHLLSNTITS